MQGFCAAQADLEQVVHYASDLHSIIAVTDAQGIMTYVNQNFLRLSGFGWDELVGKTHAVVNSGIHPPEFFEKLWQRVLTGKSWRGNIQNRTKDGEFYWVDTTICPMLDNEGDILGYTSVCTDITVIVKEKNRRTAEAENDACLKALYEATYEAKNIDEALTMALENLLVLSWLKSMNKGGIFLKNTHSSELCMINSHNLDDHDRVGIKAEFKNCQYETVAQNEQAEPADSHGDTAEHEESYQMPVIYEQEVLGVLVVYRDQGARFCKRQEVFLQRYCASLALIIRLKQKETRLSDEVARSNSLAKQAQIASEEAVQGIEAKANFLATMSHEIRTPMNCVMGMLYLIEQSDLDAEQREYASIAQSSANSLLSIIDDILDFSKYEQGAFTLEEITFDLRNFLTESLEPFRAPAQAKGLELFLQVNEGLPSNIIGDPGRLRQLITNLVANALKFTDEGKVLVKVDLTGAEKAPQMMLMVADTGMGIGPEAIENIFERFSQADSSITRKFGGTGLGLAICKTLVETMGGEIGVDTVLDEGSTFWFKVPLVAAEVAHKAGLPPPTEDEPDPLALPLNILVAEDNLHNQFLIRKMLEANAHQVTCVEDGLAAVELAASMQFDVILMDLQMPKMDGLAATREIRKLHPPYGTVPIYAVTANALSKHHQESKAAGMNGHLNKPIKPIDLFDILGKISFEKQNANAPLLVQFG